MYVCQTMKKFEELAIEKDVVLFGSGEYCMRFMNRIGSLTDRIKFICENNNQKQGGKLYGIPIVSPEKLKNMNAANTLIVITIENNVEEVHKQILSMGDYIIMTSRILINDIFSTTAEELFNNQESINKVSGLLYDKISREIFKEIIKRRMLYGECDFSDLVIKGDAEYRVPIMYGESKPENEVILDCGAYNGDTLKKFTDTFGPALKRIYTFECMEESLDKLRQSVIHVKNGKYVPDIVVLPYALSDHDGKMTLAETAKPNGSFLIDNRAFAKEALYESNYVEVDVSTIDNLIPKEERVTLIKMDIEGSEYEAIQGAKHVIQACKPKLAISIYHSGQDYYRLPLLVKELVPEYKIAIRHHNKNHCDTDMYCWI